MHKPISLLVVDRGMSFTMETPYQEPLGGAETAVALISHGLSSLGNMYKGDLVSVFLTNIQTGTPLMYDGMVSYNSVDTLPFYIKDLATNKDKLKVILVNRDFAAAYQIKRELLENNIDDISVGVWSHDAYDQPICRPLLTKEIHGFIDFMLFVSKWQMDTFIKYLDINPDTSAILPNPSDVNLSYKIAKDKNSNKLVYASIPYKGLELLPDIYNLIINEVPDAELEVYSSMRLYGKDSNADTDYAAAINRLMEIGGDRVKIHDALLSMPELLKVLAKCKVYLHPHLYHETFGMVLVQAQSVGCIPVVGGGGAVSEVLGDKGALVSNIATPCNPLIEDLAEKAVHMLTCPKPEFMGMMRAAENNAAMFDYVNMASLLVRRIVELTSKQESK